MYSSVWTQFETQSLMFGIMRKALYPKFIVRGEFGKIHIYKPTADKKNPIHLLTILVQASTKAEEVSFTKTGESEYTAIGGTTSYNIVELLSPVLHARAAQAEHSVPSPA